MISLGKKLDTSIELEIVDGDQTTTKSLAALLDRPTAFSVYMKNNTPGCDKQNVDLVQYAKEIDALGYNLVSISKDTCGSHRKYAQKLGISYILASDPDHSFSKATDSIVEKKMYGKVYKGPSRSAFIIDKDGTVLSIIEKVNTKQHGKEIIERIKSL